MGLLNKRRAAVKEVEQPEATEPETEEVEEPEATSKSCVIDPTRIQRDIARLLKFTTFEPDQRYWLDTGSKDLNAVLGSKDKGVPYGKITELSGRESAGKTTLTTILAGMAQKDGAAVGYIDLEDSRDAGWALKLGLDMSRVIQVWPKLIRQGKKEIPRLESAEMMFQEAETAMQLLSEKGIKKQFWFIDSVANIQTEMVVDAGTGGQNMRTKLDRAQFLSQTLPTWAGLAANYNSMIVLINQLRDKQGFVLGKRTYSPGGRALRHGCSVRAEVIPVKGSVLRDGPRQIGIRGKIVNEKNKAGGGSEQGASCGFAIRWNKSPAKITFMPLSEVEE